MFKKIYIGNDHGGLEAKNMIMDYLGKNGYEVINVGTDTSEIVRYPYYAAQVANAVSEGMADAGILICSTGIGMSIAANKFKNVRAALCTSHFMAKMTRCHNNSNVLCLGGKTTGPFEIMDILEAWLNNEYEGGRHEISLSMIHQGEEAMITGGGWCPLPDISIEDVKKQQ